MYAEEESCKEGGVHERETGGLDARGSSRSVCRSVGRSVGRLVDDHNDDDDDAVIEPPLSA